MSCPIPVRMMPHARDNWAYMRKVVIAVIVCVVCGVGLLCVL